MSDIVKTGWHVDIPCPCGATLHVVHVYGDPFPRYPSSCPACGRAYGAAKAEAPPGVRSATVRACICTPPRDHLGACSP